MLKEEKHATELHLESLQVPLMVISQCLSNRDQRVPPELTRDQLGEELHKVCNKNNRLNAETLTSKDRPILS